MSRGLGRMQRDILDHLEAAKQDHAETRFVYAGGNSVRNGLEAMWRRMRAPDDPRNRVPFTPTVRSGGRVHVLPEGTYDLRATLVSLAAAQRQASRHPDRGCLAGPWWEVRRPFAKSFSRAVRGLIARGLLERCGEAAGREIRFVRRAGSASPAATL